MTIIRNDRSSRQPAEPPVQDLVPEEDEIDYRWHPTEDEFVSPLTAEQWAELLGDASFAESDAAQAVRCLREYGEPATFQQLSIRYRAAMGRYRRWLEEAAQQAGTRFGVTAPQQNQFGMDEWWPLLYLTRATGKPGAGVFEMQLRPEVEKAFELLAEKEKQAKRAENARQLQRIEQLERARKEERERLAAKAAAKQEAEDKAAQKPKAQPEPAPAESAAPVAAVAASQPESLSASEDAGLNQPIPAFPALAEFLEAMAEDASEGGHHYVAPSVPADASAFDLTGPVDYALRYAERLRSVLGLMREGVPSLSAAAVARELGDESVQYLQDVLNSQKVPSFAWLDALQAQLFVNPVHLEAPDGAEDAVPAFITYAELLDRMGAAPDLSGSYLPCEIAYLVDDSKERRTGVVLRFSALRCALLSRVPVNAESAGDKNDALEVFVRMVDELDAFARREGIRRTSTTISASQWDQLAAGTLWPGAVL